LYNVVQESAGMGIYMMEKFGRGKGREDNKNINSRH
jgi:hypothetical protein